MIVVGFNSKASNFKFFRLRFISIYVHMIYILGISVVEHMILYSQCTSSASLCLIPSVHRRSGISKSSYLSWLLAVSAFYKAFRTLFRHLFTEAFSVKWLTAFHCSLALHVTQVFPVVLKSFPTSVHMLFC